MSTSLLKITTLLCVSFLMFGCGADSDLLRDQNKDDAPTGLAYDSLNKGIYLYSREDTRYLGFDYFILDEECTEAKCTLLHNNYTIFDGNVTQNSEVKYIVLGQNGWYEKTKIDECEIRFSENNITTKCADGRAIALNFTEKKLEGNRLATFDTSVITENDLKDNQATFNDLAVMYDTAWSNKTELLQIEDNDNTKCYDGANISSFLTDRNLSKYRAIACNYHGYKLKIEDASKQNSDVNITDVVSKKTFTATWKHSMVFGAYSIIEIEVNALKKPMFIGYYNGYVRIGEILPKEREEKFINKSAFNALYTQLADEYTSKSLVKKDLADYLYSLSSTNGPNTYVKVSLLDNDTISNEYGAFFDTKPRASWILTEKSLHRKSENCNADILFDSLLYRCEDGRNGEMIRIKSTALDETLIYTYLSDKNISLKLENNDTFFSVGAEEIIYRKISAVDSFIFNPVAGSNIGNFPLEDNRTNLFGQDLFVSSKDKKSYIKIIDPKMAGTGTAKVFKLKTGVELNSTTENNSTFILANLEEIQSTRWKQLDMGSTAVIEIELDTEISKQFALKHNMLLMTFNLSKPKIITGELFEQKDKNEEVSYLNNEGYKNAESAVVE